MINPIIPFMEFTLDLIACLPFPVYALMALSISLFLIASMIGCISK